MKTRLFPTILLGACTLVALQSSNLSADAQHNWQECGENWGTALDNSTQNYTLKGGVKSLSRMKLDDNLTLYGKIKMHKVAVSKNLTCYGFANLTAVQVDGVTTMYGPMNAKGCSFNDIDVRCSNEQHNVHGTVKLSDTSIKRIFISGKLKAADSTISVLTTYSSEVELTDSKVGDIIIMNGSRHRTKKATVILHNTHVKSVTFSKQGGTVILKGTAQVDSVTGGTVIKE